MRSVSDDQLRALIRRIQELQDENAALWLANAKLLHHIDQYRRGTLIPDPPLPKPGPKFKLLQGGLSSTEV